MSDSHHANRSQSSLRTARRRARAGVSLALLFASAAIPGWALAQSAPDAGREGVEEVVVTAERRTTALQETAIAVTAISAAGVEDHALLSPRALNGLVPNLYVPTQSNAYTNEYYAIRGFTEIDTTFESPVGVYIDGVYIPRVLGSNVKSPDIERIEVLRGPQGTLFGRNTEAGAISYVTREPGRSFNGSVELTTGSYWTRNAEIYVAGPLSQTLSASIAYSHEQRDGWMYNVTTDKKVNIVDVDHVRAKLAWTPSPTFKATLAIDGFKDESGASYHTPVYQPDGVPSGRPTDVGLTWVAGDQPSDARSYRTWLNMSWDVTDNLQLRSISALGRVIGPTDFRNNGGTSLTINDNYIDFDSRSQSQELQAIGAFGRLHYVAGLYFYHENFTDDRVANSGSRTPNVGTATVTDHTTGTTSYAAYGQLDYNLNDKFSATVGLRYTKEDSSMHGYGYRLTGTFPAGPARPIAPNDPRAVVAGSAFTSSASTSSSAFTPKVAVQYQWTRDVMTYASYSRGFKAGGFDHRASTLIAAGRPYRPEAVNAYEAGVKTYLADRHVVLNAAGFYNDAKDIQVSALDPRTPGQNLRFNAAKGYSTGVELETTISWPRLRVGGNLAYLFTDYTEFEGTLPANARNATSLIGLRFPLAPRWTAGLTGSYEIPLGRLGDLKVGGDVRYSGRTYSDIYNTPIIQIRPQTMVNLFASIRPANHITLTARVSNLLNHQQNQFGSAQPAAGPNGSISWFINPPRIATISLKYDF